MDYQGFTDDSLIKMYEGVREALADDEAFRELGEEERFRVRKTPAWKLHAADLEAEMVRRGITFEVLGWYEADHSVEEMHAPSTVPAHEEMHAPSTVPAHEEMHEPSAVPEQSPPNIEPSKSQMVLASLSTIDVVNVPPPGPTKEKPPRKRRTKASDRSI
jgi:hypothetical protein